MFQCSRVDDGLLDAVDEPRARPDPDDAGRPQRVGDDLARAVVGDLTAAVGPHHRDGAGREQVLGRPRPAEGEHRFDAAAATAHRGGVVTGVGRVASMARQVSSKRCRPVGARGRGTVTGSSGWPGRTGAAWAASLQLAAGAGEAHRDRRVIPLATGACATNRPARPGRMPPDQGGHALLELRASAAR